MDSLVAVTVLFGKPGAAEAWISEEPLDGTPPIGMPVRIRFQAEHISGEIEGQVYQSWGTDDEDDPRGMLVFAGGQLPGDEVRDALEIAGWEPLGEDTAYWLAGTIQDSPMVASKHEVHLMVGGIDGAPVRLFRQVISPSSATLPFFGQRLRADFLDDDAMLDGFLDDVETVEDLADLRLIIDGDDDDDELDGRDDDLAFLLEDADDISDAEWRLEQERDRTQIDQEIASGPTLSAKDHGLPCLVVYSSMIELGLARIAFWTPTLGDLTEDDFIQSGWEQIPVPGRFDPEEFNLARRVELALATHVIFETSVYAGPRLGDWWLDVPELVDEDDRSYLPPYLYELALGVRDLDSVESLVERWGHAS